MNLTLWNLIRIASHGMAHGVRLPLYRQESHSLRIGGRSSYSQSGVSVYAVDPYIW